MPLLQGVDSAIHKFISPVGARSDFVQRVQDAGLLQSIVLGNNFQTPMEPFPLYIGDISHVGGDVAWPDEEVALYGFRSWQEA